MHIVSDHGNEYTLQLREVSNDADAHFDSKVFVTPGDQAGKDKLAAMPVFVPAAELDRAKREAAEAAAKEATERKAAETKAEAYRSQYPGQLHFDYTWDRKKAGELGLQEVWRDDKFTYLRGHFQETPVLYETKDGKGCLINWDYNDGLYTVPQDRPAGLSDHRQTAGGFPQGRELSHGRAPHTNHDSSKPGPVPAQPEAEASKRFNLKVVGGIAAVILVIGLANLHNSTKQDRPLRTARMHEASFPQRHPGEQLRDTSSASLQQKDAEERQRQAVLAAQNAQLQQEQAVPGPESPNAAPMTQAQRDAMYGKNNPNAPQKTSAQSQAQAEAKQRQLERERQHQEALNSDTVAIDFAKTAPASGNANNRPPWKRLPPRLQPAGRQGEDIAQERPGSPRARRQRAERRPAKTRWPSTTSTATKGASIASSRARCLKVW